jgi:hypothetical protein
LEWLPRSSRLDTKITKSRLISLTYSSETELSKYVLDLKDQETGYSIKWSILKWEAAYLPGGRRCNLWWNRN